MTFVEPRSRTRAVVAAALIVVLGAINGIPAARAEGGPIALQRLAASDRFATAATIATSTFGSAGTAFIARGDGPDGFADALAANYPAGLLGAPVLLTNPGQLPQATIDALTALGTQAVTILGGEGAIAPAVAQALAARGLTVSRIGGADRFATAADIARAPGQGAVGQNESGLATAVLSSGRSFPDALAAGGLVWARHLPQLLTEPGSLPDATASALTGLGIQHVVITGGTGVVSDAVAAAVQDLGITVERISGDTRYDTAVALATKAVTAFGFSSTHVEIATGESFPDALAGGGHAGRAGAPTLLTPGADAGPAACTYLQGHPDLVDGHVLGGTAAVADAAVSTLAQRCASSSVGDIAVSGHGWGHGRGLGQFGAQGYAKDEGWTAAEILDHFYGGTTASTIAPAAIRVRLVGLDGDTAKVTSGQGFTAGGQPVPAGGAAWITNDAGVWTVHVADTGGCAGTETSTIPLVAPTFPPGTFGPQFNGSVPDPGNDLTKMLSVCDGAGPGVTRTYRGGLEVALDGGAPRLVNVVGLEAYLRGVVPRESPSSWDADALQAQAVAARSYAVAEARYPYAQTCDTTTCQVYRGAGEGSTRIEADSTDQAIAATAGVVRRMDQGPSAGAVARTEFSSSTGGYTAGGTFPAVPDDGDDVAGNPNHDWTERLDSAALASKYGVGAIQSVEVIERTTADQGRRARRVRITGATGTVERTGDQFRADWGLKSTWYDLGEVGA